jgi:hypothetical protein
VYEIKNRIFLDLSKTQKSALCNYLRALTKKMQGNDESEILDKFFDDEKYYLEINSSRFEFLADFIDEESFISDTKLYIKECVKYYNYKKSQEPLITAQKEFDKKKRKFLQEVKMSKELPTKKQLYYYKKLCEKYNIEQKTENADGGVLSKLDLRNEIDRILSEHQAD